MKKFNILLVAVLLSTLLSFNNSDSAEAATAISIYVNGEKQTYGTKAMIKNGSTLVPLRGIFESLGATVNWDNTAKTVDASKGSTKVWLKIGSKTAKVNNKNVQIAMPAQIVNGNTLVPLRFISESLGAQVEWNNTTKVIKISLASSATPKMKVHFIDVGQGDATFVQLATGEDVLIDAGTDAAGEKVVSYLKSLGIQELDYVIATHPDADHIGGMVDVLNAFKVLNFIDSGKVHTSQTYENMLLAIKKEGSKYMTASLNQVIAQNTKLQSYFKIIQANANATDTNDASIVIRGGYCSQDFLLMGDASSEVEAQLIAQNKINEAEFLKAGHHGSQTSSSLSFLQMVKPQTVILSFGRDNSYGHPHQQVLTNIKAIGAKTLSTAQSGTIVVTADCTGAKITTANGGIATNPIPTPVPKPTPNPKTYANCTELRKDFPNGVKKGHWAYEAKMDRDNDGYACEL